MRLMIRVLSLLICCCLASCLSRESGWAFYCYAMGISALLAGIVSGADKCNVTRTPVTVPRCKRKIMLCFAH